MKPVVINDAMQPIDFELKPGHTTRFKVVDVDGTPIQGIRIVANQWNEFRSLWWRAQTDAEGTATWNGAPADAVEYHFVAEGYAAVRDVVVAPQDEPHIVEILRPVKVTGIVTDTNQQKIPEFRVLPGQKFRQNEDVAWSNHDVSSGRNGKFEISYAETYDNIYIRIEATGYRPWTSGALAFRKQEHKVFVRLEPTAPIAGIVRSPNGDPVSGVQLTLLTKQNGMQFTDGYRPKGGKQTVTSDAKGHFEFTSVENAYLITAVHESGYAELSNQELKEVPDIQLQSWAKVKVVVRRGKTPLAGAHVSLDPDWRQRSGINSWLYGIAGVTDDEGQIEFNRVVPRDAGIYQVIGRRSGSILVNFWERSAKVALKPGATVEVQSGGSGSVVSGRLKVEGPPKVEHQWNQNDALRLTSSQANGTSDRNTNYSCLIADDGSFRIGDIAPGKYRLKVPLTELPKPNQGGIGPTLGTVEHEFEVPANGQDVDLGTIEGSWSN